MPQRVGPAVVLGDAGFADDGCPDDALVALVDGTGGYVVAATLAEARSAAGKVQGRSTTVPLTHPVDVPPGEWALTLATTWVEPAYVEPDASWCAPGGTPASPYGNGGAFGGKLHSPVAEDARRLADEHGRPVRVLWSREDVVRRGPKRPPVGAGIAADGTGVLRGGRDRWPGRRRSVWTGVVRSVAAVAPGLVVEQVAIDGPPVSFDLRAAVWAEAAVLAAAVRLAGGGAPVVDVARRGHGTGRRTGRGALSERRRARRRGGGRTGARSRRAPLLCHRRVPPGPRMGGIRRDRRGPRRADPGPHHPVVRHPAGPGHAPGHGAARWTTRRGRRSTGATRCSPRWPRPGGWPTVCRRRGRPTGPAPAGAEASTPRHHSGAEHRVRCLG